MDKDEIAAIHRAASIYIGPNDRALVDRWKINVPRFPTVRYDALDRCWPRESRGRVADGRRLRSAVLATARDLLADGGCGALTVKALAERHEVSRPTIYACLGPRPDILHSAIDELISANTTMALRCAVESGMNPIVAMADTLWFSIAVDEEFGRQMMFAVETARRTDGRAVAYKPLEANVKSALQMLMRDGVMSASMINPVVRTITSQAIATLTDWATQSRNMNGLYMDLLWGMTLPLLGLLNQHEAAKLKRLLKQCEQIVAYH